MKILNVNFSISLLSGGGTAERTFQLSKHMAAIPGVKCTVITLNTEDLDNKRIESIYPAKIFIMPYIWKRYYIPIGRYFKLIELVRDADIIHIMGHWTLINAIVYLISRAYNKPYVFCPAGALPLFGRSVILKKLYNLIIGNRIIKNANGWIAVTKTELSDFLYYGISQTNINIIPNGVDANDFKHIDSCLFKHKFGLTDNPYLLFMGRLNLIKGPDLLLDSFIEINKEFPDYHLVYAGPDGGMYDKIYEKTRIFDLTSKIHFVGYLEGEDKIAAYKFATLLVVPSRQEAMSIVAIEAGMCATPVLITDQCGFDEIRLINNNWIVSANVKDIAYGIRSLLNNSEELLMDKEKFSKMVIEKFSWNKLIYNYLVIFKKILK